MATILLIVIYISFISLGIPDSIFGAAWPAIYPEYNIPFSYGNIIIILSCLCTVLSSLFSSKVINRFGTNRVTAVSTLITALSMLGYSYAPNFPVYCLLAIPLGIGGGAIDTGLNNYIALHYKATHMNFLHCFYGIGVSISPYFMSLALSSGSWRNGYKIAFFIQFAISVIAFLSIPIWHKKSEQNADKDIEQKTLSIKELFSVPALKTAWIVLMGACAVECTTGIWAGTYFVEHLRLLPETAAKITSLFYAGLAIGRFLSGILSVKLTSWQIIIGSVFLLFASVLTMIISPIIAVSCVGLFLTGLSVGPIFPNLAHLTPKNFGEDISQSVMGTQLAASYFGIIFMPTLYGALAQNLGTWLFPLFIMALFLVTAIPIIIFINQLKKEGRF